MALGILVKGPVAPLIAALTIIAVLIGDRGTRWLGGLRPLAGIVLLAIIVLPWLIAISSATQGAFLKDSVGQDFFGKLIGAQESHGAPPLYYLVLLMASFWPGTLFLGPALAWAWRHRRADAERFMIAWAIPFWIVLELVPTKLPNYLLPVYPALALMIGRALVAASEEGFTSWRKLDRSLIAIWGLISLGLATALIAAPLRYGPSGLAAGAVAALVIVSLGWRAVRIAWGGFDTSIATRLAVMSLLVLGLSFEFIAPSLSALWLSRTAAALVATAGAKPGQPIAVAGDAEPSLVFLLGTKTMLDTAEGAAAYLAATPGALALIESRSQAAFLAALAGRPAPNTADARGEISGLDYSNGHAMTLTLYGGAPK